MKSKITALVIALVFAINTGCFASFTDVFGQSAVENAIEQLASIGIINGFEDGSFRPDQTLTRAQFAKIAVCMLGGEENAAAHSANVVFTDVAPGNWASGYINYIAEKQIINGYPDGRFGADDVINYAQALTILIRLLGYTGEDVAYRWPEGYISKADALGITKDMTFSAYENVTRANAAYIVYNTLLAKKSENSQIKLLSAQSVEDVIIYGDSTSNAGITSGYIATTQGTYKLSSATNISSNVYGRRGTLYLDGEKRATAFVPDNETVKTITVISAAINTDSNKAELSYSENANTRSESFSLNTPLYYNGNASTVQNSQSELEAGREALIFYSNSGTVERIYLKESSLSGPVTILSGSSQVYSSFGIVDKTGLSVIRDGRKSAVSSIELYDVVYYMKGNNTLYAYTDKASGTYEDAYPIKANVKSVLIGGREYSLATQKAINKMNETEGAFSLGDRVTLLFGRNGEVVDVVDMASEGRLDIGVLTSSYSEISQEATNAGERIRYIKMMMTDGNEVTYETDRDYSEYVGCVMRVNYSQNRAQLSPVKHSSIYGEFDSSVPSLDGNWLSSNCTILELTKKGSEGVTVRKISVYDITTTKLSKDQVIHAETSGSMRDITFLYVKDVTKADADFGVVSQSLGGNKYTILIGNSERTVTTTAAVSRGSAVEIVSSENGNTVTTLNKVGSGSAVTGYLSGRIRVGNETFVVSDYVKVYGRTKSETYHSMSLEEVVSSTDIDYINLYSDKGTASGGIVRVIIVQY